MAKPPPEEFFELVLRVRKPSLGDTMSGVAKLDAEVVRCNLVTDVPTFRQRTNHEVSTEDLLTEWTKHNPTFKAVEAVRHFEANGRTKGSTYPALAALVEKGVLKKLEENGYYARSDVRAIAPPKKKDKPAKAAAQPDKPATSHQTRYAVPNPELILRLAKRKHGHFTVAAIKAAFEKDGRPPTSASPAIADLMERKLVNRVGEGEYELAAIPAKQDGNGAAPVVEASHG